MVCYCVKSLCSFLVSKLTEFDHSSSEFKTKLPFFFFVKAQKDLLEWNDIFCWNNFRFISSLVDVISRNIMVRKKWNSYSFSNQLTFKLWCTNKKMGVKPSQTEEKLIDSCYSWKYPCSNLEDSANSQTEKNRGQIRANSGIQIQCWYICTHYNPNRRVFFNVILLLCKGGKQTVQSQNHNA